MFWRKRRKIKDHEFLIGIDTKPNDFYAAQRLGGSVRKMCEEFLRDSRCEEIRVSVYVDGQQAVLNLKKEADT